MADCGICGALCGSKKNLGATAREMAQQEPCGPMAGWSVGRLKESGSLVWPCGELAGSFLFWFGFFGFFFNISQNMLV